MPRIPESILNSVFYLYRSADDARAGAKHGGTGFFVSVQTEDEEPRFLYAVSNWHLVGPAPLGAAHVARVNIEGGGHELLDSLNWTQHSDGDDLAIARVAPKDLLDVAALRSTMCLSGWTPGDVGPSGHTPLFGPGNEVYFVGRYSDHEGRERNYPVVRFGNVAMMPWVRVTNDESGISQESYVVEARSIGGFSGSPVIVYPESFISEQGEFVTYVGMGTWLLGVVWGHGDRFEPVRDKQDGEALEEGWVVRQNTGLAYVVPSWKLLDLLMSDEERTYRREQSSPP